MATKTAPINMRVEPIVRDTIDTAAKLLKVDRTVFIQQAALSKAQEIIAEQRDFALEKQAYQAFHEAIEKAPKVDKGMADLLSRKSPWE